MIRQLINFAKTSLWIIPFFLFFGFSTGNAHEVLNFNRLTGQRAQRANLLRVLASRSGSQSRHGRD